MRLAYLYLLNQNYANATSHYTAAQKAKQSALSPLIGLMKISNIREHFQQSEKYGYKIVQVDHYNYYANLYLSYALRKSDKLKAAQAINLKMLGLYPEDISFLVEYGIVSYETKKYTDALSAFYYIQTLSPTNVTAKEMLIHVKKKI